MRVDERDGNRAAGARREPPTRSALIRRTGVGRVAGRAPAATASRGRARHLAGCHGPPSRADNCLARITFHTRSHYNRILAERKGPLALMSRACVRSRRRRSIAHPCVHARITQRYQHIESARSWDRVALINSNSTCLTESILRHWLGWPKFFKTEIVGRSAHTLAQIVFKFRILIVNSITNIIQPKKQNKLLWLNLLSLQLGIKNGNIVNSGLFLFIHLSNNLLWLIKTASIKNSFVLIKQPIAN